MHVLTSTAPISIGTAGTLAPGCYLVEDLNAAELLVMAERGKASVTSDLPVIPRFSECEDWNGRRVLFARSGGFGDLLFLGPILREVRRRWPAVRIGVACRPARRVVLDGLGLVDFWEDAPVSVDIAQSYDAAVSFEHVIETETRRHYVDALAASMGLTLPASLESHRCEYRVTDAERRWARDKYPRTIYRRVGVQWSASAAARSYPPRMLAEACTLLERRGWEVHLYGEPGAIPAKSGIGVKAVANDDRLTFRQTCAAMTLCDVVLAPDSALLHVAGALGLPAVGLFGPIDGRMRCAYSPSVTVLQGKGIPCAPCHFHQRHALQFPAGGPCVRSGVCDALAGITPGRVVAAVEMLGPKSQAEIEAKVG